MEPDGVLDRLARRVVATADTADPQVDEAVRYVLALVREQMHMDVAFVSRFERGQRVILAVEPSDNKQVMSPGDSDALEHSYCVRVVDGRLPGMICDVRKLNGFGELPATSFPIGAHLSTPIVLADGSIYGTLCCFSFEADEKLTERDLTRLRMAAQMIARLVDAEERRA